MGNLTLPQRTWRLGQAVAKGAPLSDPRRFGGLPFHLEKFKSIMPVIMGGKKITFGHKRTKHTKTRRSFIPNILFNPLYSRALDMQIWTCVSAHALREIDAWGGFDEYVLGVSAEKLGNDRVTLMYKRKIQEAVKSKDSGAAQHKKNMLKILEDQFGREYISKINKVQNF
ncbi:hypothetical protein BC833DRAFT_620629 [Globomyces pollinis-pini]|nr:hypothetical protein BC833DRAFT_620629 [Globomyces pollinis-pini]